MSEIQTCETVPALLPCPFCGNRAEWEYKDLDETDLSGDDGSGWIKCTGCPVSIFSRDKEEGYEQWNKRNVLKRFG